MEEQKVVLITGGASGLGRVLVEEFIKEGYQVCFTFWKSKENARRLSELYGDKVLAVNADAAEYEKAWQAQRIVLKLRSFMQQFPDSAAYIYAMKYTAGIHVKGTRHPDDMLYIPEEELRKFDKIVEDFGIAKRQ